jgi:hypothetical protein
MKFTAGFGAVASLVARVLCALLLLMSALVVLPVPVRAQTYPVHAGVAVLSGVTNTVPTVEAIARMIEPGDDVRSMLAWNSSESLPGQYYLAAKYAETYANVAAAGGQNVVTIWGCAADAGYGCDGHGFVDDRYAFPTTPGQIAAFAQWACWVVRDAGIPNLAAISIWNEANNGGFNGGISTSAGRVQALANILAVVVPYLKNDCRTGVKVYGGAYVGPQGLASWFCRLQKLGHQANPGFSLALLDGLDIHPYMSSAPLLPAQNGATWYNQFWQPKKGLYYGCTSATYNPATTIQVPLYFSEWGGPALQNAIKKGFQPNAAAYFAWFESTIVQKIQYQPNGVPNSAYPVIGRDYFLLETAPGFEKQSLEITSNGPPDEFGVSPAIYQGDTSNGAAYREAFVGP